jgi:hypothetical protein
MNANKMTNAFVWGLFRGIGNTASKRTTEYIGGKVINPKSKFRKRIEKFDLGGDFNSARKKLMVLLEMFHEEYVIGKNNLPLMQVGTYLPTDVRIIESKLSFFENMISNDETERPQFEVICSFWNNVKTAAL